MKSRSDHAQSRSESASYDKLGNAGQGERGAGPEHVKGDVLRSEHVVCMQEPEPLPSDLQAIVDAWPSLAEAVKAGMVAMVRAAKADKK